MRGEVQHLNMITELRAQGVLINGHNFTQALEE